MEWRGRSYLENRPRDERRRLQNASVKVFLAEFSSWQSAWHWNSKRQPFSISRRPWLQEHLFPFSPRSVVSDPLLWDSYLSECMALVVWSGDEALIYKTLGCRKKITCATFGAPWAECDALRIQDGGFVVLLNLTRNKQGIKKKVVNIL